ncbi:MAG: SurA N-terminal domain-containing protein [Candidatus Daviesbacteria bacterium]|nr:SurA N-terminal domain-containing protein [Candidatus Daviesbacteria bacterium]
MPRKKSGQIIPLPQDRVGWLMSIPERVISLRPSRKTYIILVIVGVLLLALYKKEWFIAATIDGTPITTLELFSRMNQQFRTQTINQIVNEKIILMEASKKQVAVSSSEIDQKIGELETQVGGREVFENLLTQQGQTRDSLKEQVRLQLIIEKLYANEATISAEEVDKFLETNSALLTSTDSAKQREEAKETIKQQKLSQIFSEKFQQIRQSADIKIY